MAIALPTCPVPNDFQVLVRDFGGVLTPFLGGPEQRINRVGTRFGLRVTLPPLEAGEGMPYLSRLLTGREQTVLLPWPLLDFDPGTPGAPRVNGNVSGGSILPLRGLTVGSQIKEGQFFSVIHNGRRYIHMFTANATANISGIASVTIYPMLRTNLLDNAVVEIAAPMIEGFVSPGDEISWSIGLSNDREISFSVMEAQ